MNSPRIGDTSVIGRPPGEPVGAAATEYRVDAMRLEGPCILHEIKPGDTIFMAAACAPDAEPREVLRIKGNGDILVHGRLASNDIEVVAALREALNLGVVRR